MSTDYGSIAQAPPTFPSLESTKLSSILNTIEPAVLNQVQLDVQSITQRYREDLTLQLDSIINFEKTILKKYAKVNEIFKKKLVDHSELLNWKLNKKIDGFKINHDDVDHYKNPSGVCEMNQLLGDVMGKLMGVVDSLREIKDNGQLGEPKEFDREKYPLLSKVLGIDDALDSFDMESYDEVDAGDLEGDEDNYHHYPSTEIQNGDLEAHYNNGEELADYDNSNDADKSGSDDEIDDESSSVTHDCNAIEETADKESGTAESISETTDIAANPDIPAETKDNSDQTTEDPLELIERSISHYKAIQTHRPSSLPVSMLSSSSITTPITTTTIATGIPSVSKHNHSPATPVDSNSAISENLKRFI